MKVKFLRATLLVAFVAVTGVGTYKVYDKYTQSNNKESDLLFANIEALTQEESGKQGYTAVHIEEKKKGLGTGRYTSTCWKFGQEWCCHEHGYKKCNKSDCF